MLNFLLHAAGASSRRKVPCDRTAADAGAGDAAGRAESPDFDTALEAQLDTYLDEPSLPAPSAAAGNLAASLGKKSVDPSITQALTAASPGGCASLTCTSWD